jgi:hypothetical protein
MAGSCIVAVRSALMAALGPAITAVVGMEDVHVDYQYPTGDNEPRECVWTQNARMDLTSASLRAGRNFLNEESHFDLLVRSARPSTTPEDAAQRAIDIAQVAIEWVGDHKNNELGVPGMQTLTVDGEARQSEQLIDSSTAASVLIPIKFTARLQ